MRKILLLGGSAQQVVVIEIAKRLGYYTVLCDFLPDNPGQYVADRFYPVSTTDKDAVLKIAEKEKVDGVLAYASDPAAPTAAYVAEKLGLASNPYESVGILCDKARFRRFLTENGFASPFAKSYRDSAAAAKDIREGVFRLPAVVKPTDSSGSKGVAVISSAHGCEPLIERAFDRSRSHTVIIEEYVEKDGYQVAGDGLSVNGELVFRCFANDHFNADAPNPFVPIAAGFPSVLPDEIQSRIHGEIQRLISLLHMRTCTYNFDIRVGVDGRIYLMEVAPRDGGNYIPQVIRYMTGIDLAEISVRAAMGERITLPSGIAPKGLYAYYAVHSLADGVLDSVEIDESFSKRHIVENHITAQPGDTVHGFVGSNTTLGCLILRFDSVDEMLDLLDHSEKWIKIKYRG